MQNIKTIAKQNVDYNNNWTVICKFIDEVILAAFILGYAQASEPDKLETTYAFLCKFTAVTKVLNGNLFKSQKEIKLRTFGILQEIY